MAGPTALTDQQNRSLAADGYLLVPSLLAADAVTSLATYLEQLRVIPGSHRSTADPADDMKWVGMGPHPDEVKLIAPAGSLILFKSASLWHSGTLNYSPELRLAVTAHLGP